jgi:Ca-activated chloride channel family protein
MLYFILSVRPAAADIVIFRGKVVMEDGSPPGIPVSIQRTCQGMDHVIVEATVSPKTGDYFVRLDITDFGFLYSGTNSLLSCVLQAVAHGYVSTRIDLTDRRITMMPRFPNIVLSRAAPGIVLDVANGPGVPRAAAKPWALAIKYIDTNDWAAAEAPLRAVVEAAPKFAPAWVALGHACERRDKPGEARVAFERAMVLDPKPLAPYLELATADSELKDWDAASKISETLIRADSKHTFLEAYLLSAVARYQLQDFDGALARLNELALLDKHQDFPRAEYILGLVYEARHELDLAAAHMRTYLAQHPHSTDFNVVSKRLANLGKQPVADLADEVTSEDLRPPSVGEAPVPGGLKAFAAIAGLQETPSYRDFFLQYCRAIASSEPGVENRTLNAAPAINAFVAAVNELEQLGERNSGHILVRLAVDTDEHRRLTERILGLLGWKLTSSGDTYSAEPGGQAIDGLRQRFPAALRMDELDMRSAIEDRRPFQFEIPIETARLVGGTAWSVLLKGVPEFSGGPAEAFIRDARYARVYAGLSAMEPDAAGAVVSSVGLANLIVKYAPLVAEFGSALTLSEGRVMVPGGAKAGRVWANLVGASPDNPGLFFRALFDKDQGRMLSFYYDLAHADASHQQFFTGPTSRIEAFYKWYRDSLAGTYFIRKEDRWQAAILQDLHLDSSGKVVFPGSRQSWGPAAASDWELLLRLPSLQSLVTLVRLENRRGAPLDAESVAVLVRHRDEWRFLFPYLEKLPGLGAPEFEALASFTEQAGKLASDRQAILGDWHSLVELIVLASQARSLDSAQAAQAFRQACEIIRADDPSAQSISVLRAMAGGADDLDEAVPARLLRLSGTRREAFERVKELQHVPALRSLDNPPEARSALAALSGLVYAAVLDPQFLLVAEDRRLLAKHNFLLAPSDKTSGLFVDSSLIPSNHSPGTKLAGGFARFGDITQVLNRREVGSPVNESLASGPPAAGEPPGPVAFVASTVPAPTETLFRASSNLVEVYATVTDSHGRYVDDLTAKEFSIVDGGHSQAITAFENHTASVSVALLFDTTGSMEAALPSLKSAALRLLDELRPGDTVAVYGFNDQVAELQPFTADKISAKRAVLRAHATGSTALYDALLRVNHDLADRPGKKVIIVFTDGDDNSSMLTADDVIQRAKTCGVPIYTIAEGEALDSLQLLDQLANMARSTGGRPFVVRRLSDIAPVFQKVSDDLMHGYLLAFQPRASDDHGWHAIKVVLSTAKGHQIRAREGYYPD